MSLHLGIRRTRKHRAVDAVTGLRDENRHLLKQLIGAHDHIAIQDHTLAEVRVERTEAEQVVVCLAASVEELTVERDQLAATNKVLRQRLAPYLAADANRNAVTVPPAERDTNAMEDQATEPIKVLTLAEAHGISPVHRIADTPDVTDPRTPTWVPGPVEPDSETTQTFRVVAA
ncbi:hypothetical protein OG244_28175 [Streptomyces brevispora]|uniref:hypothetical protein n=1 Tax=Streptomyces brevispora TaxID=887462 RepID=UPI002E2F7EDD|nr:hypothetical protein [Streptomyces brevispora]